METAAQNHLDDQVIGTGRQAYANTEVQLPVRAEIKINGREDLVLLLCGWREIDQRACRAIIFEASGKFVDQLIADLDSR